MANISAQILPAQPADQRHELARFLTWLIGITIVAAAINLLLMAGGLRLPIQFVLLGIDVASGLGLAAARAVLLRSSMSAGIVAATLVMLLGALAFTAVAPPLLPIMVQVPALVVATFLPYVDGAGLRRVLAIALLLAVGLPPLALLAPLAVPMPELITGAFVPLLTPLVSVALLALLWQFHRRLTGSLERAERANDDLRAAQSSLEAQVAARTAELQRALGEIESRAAQQAGLLDELAQQREAIRELSVPVLPVARGTLVLPLVGAIDSARIAQLHEQALGAIERSRARRLLLDVTGVPVIDTQVARGLVEATQAARLLGAEAALVGIRPEVAQTLVGLGVDLGAVRTYPDLETALR